MSDSELRNSVFNTINLLTAIESGQEEPKKGPSQQKKDINLSNTFVNGIKDKLLDPEKAMARQQEQKMQVEQVAAAVQQGMQSQVEEKFSQLYKVIQSQATSMQAMQKELETLKQRVADQHSAPAPKPHQHVPAQHHMPQSQPVQQQIHQQPAQALLQETSSDDSLLSFSVSSEDKSSHGGESSESQFIGMQSAPQEQQVLQPLHEQSYQQQPQDTFSGQQQFASQQAQALPQQDVSPAAQQAVQDPGPARSAPAEGNPRVGNYQSADVSIEKYFYFGNK